MKFLKMSAVATRWRRHLSS